MVSEIRFCTLPAHAAFLEDLKADITAKTGVDKAGLPICKFTEVPVVAPRGRYDVEFMAKQMKFHGKSFVHTIRYKNIQRLFLLPKPDGIHVAFVIGLDTPLRQGAQSHSFLVMQYEKEKHIEVDVNMEAMGDTRLGLQPKEAGNQFEIMAKILKAVSNKPVVVPCQDFNAINGSNCMRAVMKGQEGHLYPLKMSLLFIPKPVTYLRYEDIAWIEFDRDMTMGTKQKLFNFRLMAKNDTYYELDQLDRRDFDHFVEFIQNAGVKLKNLPQRQKPERAPECRYTASRERQSAM